MARIARVVAPGIPHHVTQRGGIGGRRRSSASWNIRPTWPCQGGGVEPDEKYLLAAVRYIEWNLVRAGFAVTPWEYGRSSARAHVSGKDDALVKAAPLLEPVVDWKGFLCIGTSEDEVRQLRRHERTGRPLGSQRFIAAVERTLCRTLRRGKPGPRRSGHS